MGRRSTLDIAEALTNGAVGRYVMRRRSQGDAYQEIAFGLREEYGIEVTDTTVRAWVLRLEEAV